MFLHWLVLTAWHHQIHRIYNQTVSWCVQWYSTSLMISYWLHQWIHLTPLFVKSATLPCSNEYSIGFTLNERCSVSPLTILQALCVGHAVLNDRNASLLVSIRCASNTILIYLCQPFPETDMMIQHMIVTCYLFVNVHRSCIHH